MFIYLKSVKIHLFSMNDVSTWIVLGLNVYTTCQGLKNNKFCLIVSPWERGTDKKHFSSTLKTALCSCDVKQLTLLTILPFPHSWQDTNPRTFSTIKMFWYSLYKPTIHHCNIKLRFRPLMYKVNILKKLKTPESHQVSFLNLSDSVDLKIQIYEGFSKFIETFNFP